MRFLPYFLSAFLLFSAFGVSDARAVIANAVKRGSSVYVYNEKGQQIFSKNAGAGKNDGLVGYTSKTVSIRRGNTIYTYDDRGRQLFSRHAGK
jgi:hypothetical protein